MPMTSEVLPRVIYHPDYEPYIVTTPEEAEELAEAGWHDSPADYGVITHPGADQGKFKPTKSE